MFVPGQIIYFKLKDEVVLFGGINAEAKAVCYDTNLQIMEDVDLKFTSPLVNATTDKAVIGNLVADDNYGVIVIKPEHQEYAKEQLQKYNDKFKEGALKPAERVK